MLPQVIERLKEFGIKEESGRYHIFTFRGVTENQKKTIENYLKIEKTIDEKRNKIR